MQVLNAVALARFALRNAELGSEIEFGTALWFSYAGICAFLVLFAGLMSGLTLGLMSLSLVDLEILKRSGTPTEQKQSAAILPVVQKQHQLLVTLLLCNAASMEALPIYLDKLFNQYIAIILSVTLVLAFGEVIPQAICTRYGLAVGANFVWLVRILMILCYPISYPIGKTAQEAMTPFESTFSLDVDSKLDWEAMGKILARGHSRVPVYSGNPRNIIGLLLVKTLLTVRPETETPVSAVSIRKIPRVPADMPLYDILNEFQKGHSHMAAVVKAKPKSINNLAIADIEKSNNSKVTDGKWDLATPLLSKLIDNSESIVDIDNISKESNMNKPSSQQPYTIEDIDEGEVIGIITLEDVFEELLQEEIVDETDEYVDVHKRIRVAAVAAASSVARAPSYRRLTSQKTLPQSQGGQSRHGQSAKKLSQDAPASTK
ncbi:DUF21 domain-containing protein At4g14240 isoform X2 [Beta vulgaris subsp. vulgaris]|uniref:DUF21 domain-containing protein At4g14240 isoform X2 n=1 Tax=Beta vulgaris subsp. vulgaris TaxID=3555 RepID=UPI002036D1FF|nr:DUF21 domain-containing protein At4g14240 isoform X2 [Beta vulgaris subsp. vulgaris]